MQSRYNIVVVGKTGVGKSSLINYLYGNSVRKTGVGVPVTKSGFHSIDFTIKGLPVTLFDSNGLEVGTSEKWKKNLQQELEKRGTNSPFENWFHTVLYCISSSSSRIELFEKDIINIFVKEKYKAIIVFTKADQVDKDDLALLKKAALEGLNEKIEIVEVVSEAKKDRKGNVSPQEGKEELEEKICCSFFDSASARLPEHCISFLKEELHRWKEAQIKDLEPKIERWNYEEIKKAVNDNAESFLKKKCAELIQKQISKAFSMYNNILNSISNLPEDPSNKNSKLAFPKEITLMEDLKNIKWWAWPILLPAFLTGAIPAAIATLYFAADDNKKAFIKYIDSLEENMKKEIDNMKKNIEKLLEDLSPKKEQTAR